MNKKEFTRQESFSMYKR